MEYFLVKPNQIEVVLDEHPEYEKLNDLIFPSFQKFSFLLILLISLSWLVTIALTQGYKLLVFVCFLQVSVHRWHAWGFAAWKEGEIVVLINFFMFVISVLLALDEVAYDKCAGLRIERTRYETSLTKVLHAFVVFFGNTLRFVFLLWTLDLLKLLQNN